MYDTPANTTNFGPPPIGKRLVEGVRWGRYGPSENEVDRMADALRAHVVREHGYCPTVYKDIWRFPTGGTIKFASVYINDFYAPVALASTTEENHA